MLYNRYVLGLRGLDQLPSLPLGAALSALAAIPSFFRRSTAAPASSGFRRGIPRSWQGGGGGGGNGYIGLPTDDEEASRPLNGGSAGPFALDDDEIDERDLHGPSEVSHHHNNPPPQGNGTGDGIIRL